ncbi:MULTISPECIES: hypothetical protein [unclassified Rhizobium]|uniref:hypothetical protein n=1 Tax=unclassified Rhizobium TaxID=2613769 RepID=UPI002167FFCE|nr:MULTISPECIES: hypothetical protein [unclassified Rhizobium]MCS3743366.1 hypothetical protein [Rhizobium sp. BK661]MCS4095891.1 hypothetical protein [Rhizobium sp. BK176]
MSSNEYSAYVSQNLVRTSTFGYHEQATLRVLLDPAVTRDARLKLPLAGMRAFPDFGVDGKSRMRTAL